MTWRRLLRNLALFLFHIFVVRPTLKLVVGVRYRRRGLVPKGACVVVANHNSHLDAPVLMSLFPVRRLAQVHPVAAADYFGETWLRRTMALLLMNAIPIQRSPAGGQDPLAPVVRALEEGESIILFPEGTRGEAGVVAPFRSGVGRIVRAFPGAPVVPVFLRGPERIWPRGEVVPVPLGIDVHVGRPRRYDPTKDPREIAEEARRDVLCLAPPAPSVPGPKTTSPVLVGVCGGQPHTRRAIAMGLLERLGENGPALGLMGRVVEADGRGVREVPTPPVRKRPWLGPVARLFGTRPPFDGLRFADLAGRARMEQGLANDPEARFIVTDGSTLLELLAATGAEGADDREMYQRLQYAEAQKRIPVRHWWRVAREAPEVWLLNTLNLARLPTPNVLVLLVEHEAYRRVGEMLRRWRKTEFLEIGSSLDAEAIVEAAAEACRRVGDVPQLT